MVNSTTITSFFLWTSMVSFAAVASSSKSLFSRKNALFCSRTNSIDVQLNSIKFGYETVVRNVTTVDVSLVRKLNSRNYVNNGRAACYSLKPSEARPKGCAPLLENNLILKQKFRALQPLPCIVDGTCPFTVFQCNKGHTWVNRSSPLADIAFLSPIFIPICSKHLQEPQSVYIVPFVLYQKVCNVDMGIPNSSRGEFMILS